MGRITIETSNNTYVVGNRLLNPEAINEREMNAIAAGLFERLIPVKAKSRKKDIVLKSTVEGMISLKTYFSAIVNKKMFLDVISQIISIVKECDKKSMNTNNLLLEMDYIFLEPQTKRIKCIFWPIVNNQNPRNTYDFFHDIPFNIVFNKYEDTSYVNQYVQYVKSNYPFSINSFERFICEMMGKTIEDNSHMPSASTEFATSNTPLQKAHEEKTINEKIAYNPFEVKNDRLEKSVENPEFCINCKSDLVEGANFCKDCGSPIVRVQAIEVQEVEESKLDLSTQTFSETTVLGTEDFIGGTTVLGAEAFEEPTFPYLLREKTQEKIMVDKPSFRIGKEQSFCDYFISNNNAISRSHADIITKESRYFIVDHNSTNKTYVDSRVIPVEKEVEIFSGTKLRLANEDFVFYI